MKIVSISNARTRQKTTAIESGRFQPPRALVAPIYRTGLIEQLLDGRGKLTLLVGPPGSGKSTALASCYASLSHGAERSYWLSLSSQDDDPAILRRRLCEAFYEGIELEDDELPQLANGITGFIDGLECITQPATLALLETFLLDIPTSSRLIACGLPLRSPALYNGRLRGLVRVVGPDGLRFEDREAATLLAQTCSASTATHINRFVGGWAAGLRFFANHIEVAGPPPASTTLRVPAEMAEYFDDVLCAGLSAIEVEVLIQLAVVERFCPTLLAALPHPPCDWQWVTEKVRAGTLIYYTNATRDWVCFNPAFAQHLRERLQHSRPKRHAELQAAALTWLADNGFRAEAMRLAMTQPNNELSAAIIEKVGALSVDLDNGPDTNFSSHISPERAAELPLLFLAQTYQRIRQGNHISARREYEQAWLLTEGFTRLRSDSDAAEVLSWARIMQVVFRSVSDSPIGPEYMSMLDNEMRTHLAAQPVLAGSIASVLVHSYVESMRYADAAAVCTAALAAQPQPPSNKASMWIRVQQTGSLLARNSITEARNCIEDAWRLARIEGSPDSYELLTTDILKGVVLYEDDQSDEASALLTPALSRVRSMNGWVSLYYEGYSAAASIANQSSGWEAAERLIRDGEDFASERELPRLRNFLGIIRLRELISAGELRAATQLLEAPNLAQLLRSSDVSPYLRAQQLPAQLEAARLMLKLSRANDALNYLQSIDSDFISKADNRLRFHYQTLMTRAMHALRRSSAASTHLQAAVEIARVAGLRRRLREQAFFLVSIYDALSTNVRGISNVTSRYIEDALRPMSITTNFADSREASHSTSNPGVLSPRETQILTLMAGGCINKEIAARLGISEGTVKTHRKKIYEKLGAANRSQAINRAQEMLIL